MNTSTALDLANRFKIPLDADFFALDNSIVCAIIGAADVVKYRKPKNANGSRARYFYAAMQRATRERSFSGFIGRIPPVF